VAGEGEGAGVDSGNCSAKTTPGTDALALYNTEPAGESAPVLVKPPPMRNFHLSCPALLPAAKKA
jgi:hypothetical protein